MLKDLTLAICFLLATLPAMQANAQVIRCTDPGTGKVTYTDGNCSRGSAAVEVETRKSAEDIHAERERAAEANQRKLEQRALESRVRSDQEREERNARRQSDTAAANPGNSVACQQARRNLQEVESTLGRGMYDEQSRHDSALRQFDQSCLTPAEQARARREQAREQSNAYNTPYGNPYGNHYYPPAVVVRPPRPVHPVQPDVKPGTNMNCNVFRCTDSKGNVFPR